MNKIFITGDRSMSAMYMPLIAIEMLRAVSAGAKVSTGDNTFGVELVVRELAEKAGVEVEVVPMTVAGEKPTADEWDARHAALTDTEIVAIHADPHASSVVKSLFRVMDDDAVRIVTPADLLV